MVGKVGLQDDIIFTGGVAKNQGILQALLHETGKKNIIVPPEPQITGALGAAIIAMEDFHRERGK
jgi:activator of 2-hydroxyglutaryl-CoA dehydratase